MSDSVSDLAIAEMTAWRRNIHACPELDFLGDLGTVEVDGDEALQAGEIGQSGVGDGAFATP